MTDPTLTPSANKRIAKILSAEEAGTALRLSVEGGGCSGFSYKYDLVQNDKQAEDLVLGDSGSVVLVDQISLMYLAGAEIDFVDDLMGQSFQINNPNATSSCGCGTSFSV
jgi:iron-sulfur cluster assembly accessory protein